MAANKEYRIIINAVGKGIRATTKNLSEGMTRGKKAMTAFNAAATKGRRVSNQLTSSIKGLVGAYAGWQGVTGAVRIIKDADQATFNLSSSVKAANREFENTGNLDEWQQRIDSLSKRLVIYSDTALKNAAARTVDMTKRLGLEADQMEELIARAGDLGAGKVDLEGAIERVSAAMRGEAESAEYLGLTLNENYIKDWYEANAATETAWKNLTDVQKAQVRYQVFLEQTNEMQGRAADSAKTLGGAWQLVKKEIDNAVSDNKEVVAAMNQVAQSLRDNAGEIGRAVAGLVTAGAKAAELAIKWKNVIIAIGGTTVVYGVLEKLVGMVKGINAAFAVMTGSSLLTWLARARAGFQALAGAIAASSLALGALVAAFTVGLAAIATDVYLVIKAVKEHNAEWKRAIEHNKQLKRQYEGFKNIRIVPQNLGNLGQKELKELQERLYKARAYYQMFVQELEGKAKEKTYLGAMSHEAKEAEEQLDGARARLTEIRDWIAKVESQSGFEKTKEDIAASDQALKTFKKTAKEAYSAAEAQAKKYGEKIKEINQSIADRELSLQDKIRELRRQNMSDERAAADLRLQAIEKEQAAREALAKYRRSGSERDLELARRFAGEAESSWTQYADGGKEATEEAIGGLKRVNETLDQADKIKINTFQKMKDDAEKAMTDIQDMVDHINANIKLEVPVLLKNLEKARNEINSLIRDETKHIKIKVSKSTSEERAAGGRVGMAKGGRFPGDSKKDSIPVLARPGEGFVRNEALKVWDSRFGRGFFEAINAPWSAAGKSLIQALSGRIQMPKMPNLAPSRPAPTRAFATGGRVSGPGEVFTLNLRAGNVETPLSVLGRGQDLRDQVQALDAELRKMGLSRG